MEANNITTINTDALFKKISVLIEESRKKVATAVNIAEVYTKYEIGRYIVEDEQYGKHKAEYGKQVIIKLSERLSAKFGAGWSEDTLSNCRKFYKTYSRTRSSQTSPDKSKVNVHNTNFLNAVSEIQNTLPHLHKFVLSWSHYLVLMRIKDENARNFYEIESRKRSTLKQGWSLPSSARCNHFFLNSAKGFFSRHDRNVKQDFEKPTVGILLCKEKKDALVELTLPKDSNIYAAQYELYLPNKKKLQEKLKSWIEEFDHQEYDE